MWELIGPSSKMMEWIMINDDEESSGNNSDSDGL
jgi:hypothetical protein